MPRAKLQMTVETELGARYAAVLQRLALAGRTDELKKRMVRDLRKQGQPAVRAVRAALKTARLPASPSRGGGRSSGLRNRAAGAVGISTTGGGLSIQINGRKVDPRYGTSLSLALNGVTRLRHPVFGNRAAWVTQRGTDHFYRVLDQFAPRWRADMEKTLNDYAKELDG